MNVPDTANAVTVAAFAEAADVVRVTLAVYEGAVSRREEARQVLAALQCREEFRWTDGVLPEDPAEWAGSDYCEFVDECELPAGHAGDHAPDPSPDDDVLEYRAAVTAWQAAVESAEDAREAWEDAGEVLAALRCGLLPGDGTGWPCVQRRGHRDDEGTVCRFPSTVRLVF